MPDTEPNPYQDYLKANEGRLLRIDSAIIAACEAPTPLGWQIAFPSDDISSNAEIERRPADDIYYDQADSDDVAISKAIKEAQAESLARARMSVISVSATARISFLSDLYDAEGDTEETRRIVGESERFTSARVSTAEYTTPDYPAISVVTTQISGMNHIGDVHQTEIVLDDGTVKRRTTISRIGDKLIDCSTSLKPNENKLLDRARAVFNTDAFSTISTFILPATYRSEAELDELLDSIATNHDGTSEEAAALLKKLRQAALATHAGRLLDAQFATRLPSIQHLDELVRLLES